LGAPACPAASSGRVEIVRAAIHDGASLLGSDAQPDASPALLLPVAGRSSDALTKVGADALRRASEHPDARLRAGDISALASVSGDTGEGGTVGCSYQDPSLPLPSVLCFLPPLLYGGMMVDLYMASVAGAGRLNCCNGSGGASGCAAVILSATSVGSSARCFCKTFSNIVFVGCMFFW